MHYFEPSGTTLQPSPPLISIIHHPCITVNPQALPCNHQHHSSSYTPPCTVQHRHALPNTVQHHLAPSSTTLHCSIPLYTIHCSLPPYTVQYHLTSLSTTLHHRGPSYTVQ
ncbi:hypothetical protein ElyMa_006690300 [Elysia marginata]|uniref:Uncharacterized protein n=1 Tax=Elysia marginata TaxID=1093978 RepID=A0AAV4IPV6_9GAST|nr:hypothetical protein ElyMa_006690300 [Elysia marginata]